jgi:hypothetical protein
MSVSTLGLTSKVSSSLSSRISLTYFIVVKPLHVYDGRRENSAWVNIFSFISYFPPLNVEI